MNNPILLTNALSGSSVPSDWQTKLLENWKQTLSASELFTLETQPYHSYNSSPIDVKSIPRATSPQGVLVFDILDRFKSQTAVRPFCWISRDLYLGSIVSEIFSNIDFSAPFLIVGKGKTGSWRALTEEGEPRRFEGEAEEGGAYDFFCFGNTHWKDVPELHLDGPNWVHWFTYEAFRKSVPVYDITETGFGLRLENTRIYQLELLNTAIIGRDAASFGERVSLRNCFNTSGTQLTCGRSPISPGLVADICGFLPTENVEKKPRVLLHGGGVTANRTIDILIRHFDIQGIVDRDPNLHGAAIGPLLVEPVETAFKYEFEWILVLSSQLDSIRSEWERKGVPAEKIVPLPYEDGRDPTLLDRHDFLAKETRYMVYAMGKSASIACRNTLAGSTGSLPYHFHYVTADTIEQRQEFFLRHPLALNEKIVEETIHLSGQAPQLKQKILKGIHQARHDACTSKLRILCSIREPMTWLLSMSCNRFYWFDLNESGENINRSLKLFTDWADEKPGWKRDFVEYQRVYSNKWFENEIAPILDITLDSVNYSFEDGWGYAESNETELLIIRLESLEKLPEALQIKWGLKNASLARSNEGDSLPYRSLYKGIKDNIKFSKSFLKRFYAESYATRFYSKSEIEGFIKIWSRE